MAEQSEKPKLPQAVPIESIVGKSSFWQRFKSAVGLKPSKSQVRPLTPEERQALDQKLGSLSPTKQEVQAQLHADQQARDESYRNRPSYVTPKGKELSSKQKALLAGAGMAAGAIAGAAAVGGFSGRGNETSNPTMSNEPAHTQTMEAIPSMQTPVGIEDNLNAPQKDVEARDARWNSQEQRVQEAKEESDAIRNTPTVTATSTKIPADSGAPETFEEVKDFVPNTGKPKP